MHDKFGLETEHLLALKKEESERNAQANQNVSQETKDTSKSAGFDSTQFSNDGIERQPFELKTWPADKQQAWFK